MGAFFSGIGGGAFASSMSNISFFFPKAKQGLALGLNAGIGNLGVSLTQLLVPIMMTYAAFGQTDPIGFTRVYNGAMWWFPFCIVMAVLGWMYMSDMPQHGNKPFLQRVFYYASLNGQAYACSAIAYGVAMGTFRSALMDTPTGIANGSTFKQISAIFLNIGQPEQAGPVLGWSSALQSPRTVPQSSLGFWASQCLRRISPTTCTAFRPISSLASS